ncbi:GntR family transcriptional regulator [Streptomyces sp. SID13588]|uniref:GntR family transcriptional regulator n=1 Tax=Streptomyces sp. SID13588 TaxID=2706051 RepID=UPI0013CB2720|nr:GntR family transcriptional regulator [Streptomyces sp. SID13588]NEA77212.1 GntR family transcriptional regulator [Streptomyces sp. SID13588]
MSETRYTELADHYRRLILSGDLEPSTRLPTVKDLCAEWRVASATVSRALEQLRVEGLITTTTRGTFVANDVPVTLSAQDRLARARRTGHILATGETARVTHAELVQPPLYVAELFELDPGDQVVRRQFVVGRGRERLMLAVNWYPAHFAALVPDLLSTAPGKVDGLIKKVLSATGRTITHARDDMHARPTDERESALLGVPLGAPTLAGAHRWYDETGVIEYGEWCLPPRLTVSYSVDPEGITQ